MGDTQAETLFFYRRTVSFFGSLCWVSAIVRVVLVLGAGFFCACACCL